MILRAAGISRTSVVHTKAAQKGSKSADKTDIELRAGLRPARKAQPKEASHEEVRPEASFEAMTTLFVSMGKRHHLKPNELRAKIAERTGIPLESIGKVHLLQNYSFVEVSEKESSHVISAMTGTTLNGHPLEIKPAKKRTEVSQRPAAQKK